MGFNVVNMFFVGKDKKIIVRKYLVNYLKKTFYNYLGNPVG
jgi:hypothetical protein